MGPPKQVLCVKEIVMRQFEAAPLPGFQAPQTAGAFLIGILLLLIVFLSAFLFVNNLRLLGQRWLSDRGDVMVSLLGALCATFVACMM